MNPDTMVVAGVTMSPGTSGLCDRDPWYYGNGGCDRESWYYGSGGCDHEPWYYGNDMRKNPNVTYITKIEIMQSNKEISTRLKKMRKRIKFHVNSSVMVFDFVMWCRENKL